MKIRTIAFAAAMVFTAGQQTLTAQVSMTIPNDTAIVTGKLPNGLTYYVRHNNWPEHRVNFYIAQRVGSIQENDDQRGLAHFLEHMAFNGSEHYHGNSLIEYLRSIGVEFGADLNAYTSTDQTVYRICNVPSARTASLDSCMLVLKDWSNGLLLEADEIDKERGVIHDEWRQRSSAIMRILERQLPTLYPDSKYGQRLPIGKMEIVDNFKPEALRQYYKKWYRPDNQAIIVVGDIDVNRTVDKIKEMFGIIPVPAADAAKVIDEPVPDNNEAIIVVDKDKELQNDFVEIDFKHDPIPDSLKSQMPYLVMEYSINMASTMLNSRLNEISQNEDCPFINASVDDGQYIMSKTKDAFSLGVTPKPNTTDKAVEAALREVFRAKRYGFTETEYARTRSEYLSQLEKAYNDRNKRDNSTFGDVCRDNFLSNEPMPSIEYEYTMMSALAGQIPLAVINQTVQQLVSETDTNLVVLSVHTDKEGNVVPTKESMAKSIASVRAEQLTPWVDKVKNEPLIKQLPKAGKIVKEKAGDKFGTTELTLSNGARVILKKTDYKESEVLFRASSKGGSSLYGSNDFVNLQMFNSVIGASGLGEFSDTELTKALAGKQASAGLSLSALHEVVSGESTPKDLETMFQLVYLNFTDIRKDMKSYNSLITSMEASLKNKDLSPDAAFGDSISMTVYDHNPRFAPMTLEKLKQVDYDRILQIAKERTANAADFTFYIVGNFDNDSIRPLIERYIASLPAKGKKEQWKPVSTYAKGNVTNSFKRKMETPNTKACMLWLKTGEPYTLEKTILADAAGQVLDMVYLKKIREEASASYAPNAGASFSGGGDVNVAQILGSCPMAPEKAELGLSIMNVETDSLAKHVDADMLAKVKELMLKRIEQSEKTNSYWLSVVSTYDELGRDNHTDCRSIVEAMTPEKVQRFVSDEVLKGGSCIKVIMQPE